MFKRKRSKVEFKRSPGRLIEIIRMKPVIWALQEGNPEPLAREVENGNLSYVQRFMTPEDNIRLARTIRTGSPLTKSEKRKTRNAEQQRDADIIVRVCYWKAKGLPLYSHTSTDTAIHRAAADYSAAPIPGAPARTPESIRKHVWAPMQSEAKSLPHEAAERAAFLFIQGLKESGSSEQENAARFIWFGKHILESSWLVSLESENIAQLENLIDMTDPQCRKFRVRILELHHRTSHLTSPPDSGQK